MDLKEKEKNDPINSKRVSESTKSKSISNLSSCLEEMRVALGRKSDIAKIIENWPNLVGEQLSRNCSPLRIQQGTLFIGAEQAQWRQALIYSRMKLLANIKSSGHEIKDIRIQQHYHSKIKDSREDQQSIWERHPSRTDVHGIATCSSCNSPAPAGEMALWGKCGFCRRANLDERTKNNIN